jgi:hypothetical protein
MTSLILNQNSVSLQFPIAQFNLANPTQSQSVIVENSLITLVATFTLSCLMQLQYKKRAL